ncbi:MAG: DUF1559 domain-containing protein, partial [Planctomycetales bacterium]|nr:DUF1559 domain-containing protein [Planctomycetales bacterium]
TMLPFHATRRSRGSAQFKSVASTGRSGQPNPARGFTLVELLVVIAIIGVLVALLLPAVQAAREAARRIQCMNQVKQIALAAILHEETHGFYPSGGWGWNWVGDPDMGFGESQPGSWIFSVLPFMEDQAVWAMGQGVTNDVEKKKQLSDMNARQPGGFICPTRRPVRPTGIKPHWTPVNCNFIEASGKSDYAINVGGDATVGDYWGFSGPRSLAEIGSSRFSWPDPENFDVWGQLYNGVCHLRSEIKVSQIVDGTSKTYLVGEKYLRPESYDGVGAQGSPTYDTGDNETIFSGFNRDHQRSAFYPPQQDRPGAVLDTTFGSAHPGAFNMSMCDGSVASITYDIDSEVHRQQAIRSEALGSEFLLGN